MDKKIGRMKRREEKIIRDARSLATDPKIQAELDEKIEQFNRTLFKKNLSKKRG